MITQSTKASRNKINESDDSWNFLFSLHLPKLNTHCAQPHVVRDFHQMFRSYLELNTLLSRHCFAAWIINNVCTLRQHLFTLEVVQVMIILREATEKGLTPRTRSWGRKAEANTTHPHIYTSKAFRLRRQFNFSDRKLKFSLNAELIKRGNHQSTDQCDINVHFICWRHSLSDYTTFHGVRNTKNLKNITLLSRSCFKCFKTLLFEWSKPCIAAIIWYNICNVMGNFYLC